MKANSSKLYHEIARFSLDAADRAATTSRLTALWFTDPRVDGSARPVTRSPGGMRQCDATRIASNENL